MSEALTYDEIMALPNGAALWWPGGGEVLTLDIHDVRPAFNCVDAAGKFTGHLYPYHVIEHCGEVFRISASTGGHLMTADVDRQANAVERIIERKERGERKNLLVAIGSIIEQGRRIGASDADLACNVLSRMESAGFGDVAAAMHEAADIADAYAVWAECGSAGSRIRERASEYRT